MYKSHRPITNKRRFSGVFLWGRVEDQLRRHRNDDDDEEWSKLRVRAGPRQLEKSLKRRRRRRRRDARDEAMRVEGKFKNDDQLIRRRRRRRKQPHDESTAH